MPNYIDIPAGSIKQALSAMGMVEKATPPSRYSSGEVYFEMPTAVNPQLVIKVYTSISVGGGQARGRGQDAIRVCLVWRSDERETQSVGLVKTIRVHRVTSVASTLKRLKERVRDCNRQSVELNARKCSVCGCPVWPESGRCRNRKCGMPRPAAPAPAPAPSPSANASARLNAAFGAAHSPMTQAMAARAAMPAPAAPVAQVTAARRLAKEADRNQAEEPVLTNADMPPELRGLF